MRKIFIFKTILDLMFIMSIFGILGFPFRFFLEEGVKINGYDIETQTVAGKTILFFSFIAYLGFVYVLYLFKKTGYLLLRKKIFDLQIIANLNKVGWLLLLITTLLEVPIFFYNVTFKQNIEYNFRFNTPFFSIAIGLFFMIISEILKIAKRMKEENDLTI